MPRHWESDMTKECGCNTGRWCACNKQVKAAYDEATNAVHESLGYPSEDEKARLFHRSRPPIGTGTVSSPSTERRVDGVTVGRLVRAIVAARIDLHLLTSAYKFPDLTSQDDIAVAAAEDILRGL